MTEIAQTDSPARGSHRGRGSRPGRYRRGRRQGPRPSVQSHGNEGDQPSEPELPRDVAQPAATTSEPQNEDSTRGGRPGRGRGGRGRSGGRGRGGTAQRSVVVSHRGGRGPPQAPGRGGIHTSGQSLSAAADEFVPGQPVSFPRSVIPPPAPVALPKSTAADLPTRIHEDIDRRQYECVICTNEVLRNSKVWSCPVCWTVTHLHCVKKWHTNQMKEKEENQRPNQPEGWRCPGCNSSLVEQPGPHRCWCGKDTDPKPIAGLPPHTCGQSCSKTKATCPHQCSLMCHAGPCPPCTLMGPAQPCFCGKHTSTKRCAETDYGKGWSCQELCGDLLPCGEHSCDQPCHAGLCGSCEIPMLSSCYCGKEKGEIACNKRDDILESFNHRQLKPSLAPDDDEVLEADDQWFEGSFRCDNICGRPFDCGTHTCQKPCHAQDEEAAHCPLSPDVVTHCPCGKTLLTSMSAASRKSCEDPIPHCDKPCNKVLACGHLCLDECHTGPCAPCPQYADIPCRCGRTTNRSACHQGNIAHPHCFRVCKAQLNCGRHECGERCCSGEKVAAERRKHKRNVNVKYEPEHICLQVCGRQLKCGNHACQQLCHKGPCASCPEAIFDEINCACGRTVLQPPQPCGTRPPECRFPCRRASPCGHPSIEHQCHPEDTPCPKCPYLMEKPCVCGKKTLKNQPCWFGGAQCGLPCGEALKCGNHKCRKACHKPGECEDAGIPGTHCSQLCGKARKSCGHPCAEECHAPDSCRETKPCQFKTFITCPCQRRKQEVRCQATILNPSVARESALRCDDECDRLQRNRKLAEALHIDPNTHTDDHIPYSDTTLKKFRENVNWAQEQERELRVFANAPEVKRIRFKPMPSHRRAFLHALAEDFGLDSESQDPEPHRHVCIFKTPRFVSAPHKTLAQCLRIANTAARLGAVASSLKPAPPPASQQQTEFFNALLLKDLRFALTLDELNDAIATELASASRSGPALSFSTTFLPSEEILIKATPNMTAAAIATSLTPTPQAVEKTLSSLKSSVSKITSREGLAGGVVLCHADAAGQITRREGDTSAKNGGWNAVAGRGSWRKLGGKISITEAKAVASEQRPRSTFVALRKSEPKAKPVVLDDKVVGDWAAAVEEEEEEGGDGVETDGEDGVEKAKDDHDASDDANVDRDQGQEVVVEGLDNGLIKEDGADLVGIEQAESKQEEEAPALLEAASPQDVVAV
ncbi:uncharacterized protein C8A04DRAFT_8826 [Dichotomopilus funicola]|uniref:R3H domain-containing protein n=1 Tax=Dichotomopilus funicola TaxID=1934379 RepID=A0AAN6ZS11_9PEZI|nr:hypothetical protein C8A04DRAFT_8826 [Dichotomopilus funicola]